MSQSSQDFRNLKDDYHCFVATMIIYRRCPHLFPQPTCSITQQVTLATGAELGIICNLTEFHQSLFRPKVNQSTWVIFLRRYRYIQINIISVMPDVMQIHCLRFFIPSCSCLTHPVDQNSKMDWCLTHAPRGPSSESDYYSDFRAPFYRSIICNLLELNQEHLGDPSKEIPLFRTSSRILIPGRSYLTPPVVQNSTMGDLISLHYITHSRQDLR